LDGNSQKNDTRLFMNVDISLSTGAASSRWKRDFDGDVDHFLNSEFGQQGDSGAFGFSQPDPWNDFLFDCFFWGVVVGFIQKITLEGRNKRKKKIFLCQNSCQNIKPN